MAGSKAVYSRWSGNALVYYTAAGLEIFRIDGTLRSLSVPSGAALIGTPQNIRPLGDFLARTKISKPLSGSSRPTAPRTTSPSATPSSRRTSARATASGRNRCVSMPFGTTTIRAEAKPRDASLPVPPRIAE